LQLAAEINYGYETISISLIPSQALASSISKASS